MHYIDNLRARVLRSIVYQQHIPYSRERYSSILDTNIVRVALVVEFNALQMIPAAFAL